jgi:hypothetical protein
VNWPFLWVKELFRTKELLYFRSVGRIQLLQWHISLSAKRVYPICNSASAVCSVTHFVREKCVSVDMLGRSCYTVLGHTESKCLDLILYEHCYEV